MNGIIHGERSFAANSREHGRIRPHSPRIRANPPTVRQLFFWRTLANHWRTLRELPRTLAEFARIRPNSRGVRRELANSSPEKCFYLTFFNFSANIGERLFAANISSPRTSSLEVRRERVRQLANLGSPTMKFCFSKKSFAANNRSPRLIVRRERLFATRTLGLGLGLALREGNTRPTSQVM